MWIAPALTRNIAADVTESLTNAVRAFEQEIGAPVRVMEPGDTRVPARMLGAWTGNSGNMARHEGFTEEDRDERGISISFMTWSNEQGEPTYHYQNYPGSLFTRHGAGQGGATQRQAEQGVEIEWFINSEQQIESAEGIPLMFEDGNGQPWGALYGGRALYVGAALFSVARWGIPDWDAWLFQPIREAADPEAREEAARRREARSRQLFEELMADQGNIAIRSLREELNQDYARFAEAQEQVVNLKANLDQRNNQLAILLEQEGELTAEQIEREWTSIHRITGVKAVSFGQNITTNGRQEVENPWMRIDTDRLWLENPRNGRKLPLGEFSLFLNFGIHTVRINNITMRMNNEWDHPHVQQGKLCVGEYGPTITSLLRQRKLAAMTNMIFRILRGVNLDDTWGRNNIRLWVEHDDEQRRANGWPAWVEGEETHPMLAGDTTTQENNA